MSVHLKLLLAATLLVFIINIPFGYWRSRTRRFSPQWLLAIHLPIPLVILCRLLLDIGWQLISFPLFIGAFFAGQFAGGMIQHLMDSLG
jgi:hypothetical protein